MGRPLEHIRQTELRIIHQIDQKQAENATQPVEVFAGKKIDPYMSFDKRRGSIGDNPELCFAIEKQQRRMEREDIASTWHTRPDGRLSKKLYSRQDLALSKLIADFSA